MIKITSLTIIRSEALNHALVDLLFNYFCLLVNSDQKLSQ